MSQPDFDTLMEVFTEKRIMTSECCKILIYFYGDELRNNLNRYISENAQVLWGIESKDATGSSTHDSSRRSMNKAIEIVEQLNTT